MIATRISSSLVTRLRGRFGVAAPRPVAPATGGQSWQQPGGQQPPQQFAQPPYPQPAGVRAAAYQQPYEPAALPQQPRSSPPHEQPPYPQQQPLPPVPPPSQ